MKPIKTDEEYSAALAALEKVFDAKPGSVEGNKAELLMILVQDYERTNYPIAVSYNKTKHK